MLQEAMKLAVEKHKDQKRQSLEIPYVSHCFDVMKRVSQYGLRDETVLIAAILHDTVEDTDLTLEEIEQQFGQHVRLLVEDVTISEDLPKGFYGKFNYLKSFAEKSFEAVTLKIADRICNINDYLSVDKSADYAPKYALQAFPLFKTFLDRFKGNSFLQADLQAIDSLINRNYGISMFQHTIEEAIKAFEKKKQKIR